MFRSAEQDITGDVLLELDLDLLKTEIGIIAFGKRKRIANAIMELKRSSAVPQTAHSESLFSHSRSISSAQGSSLNSPSLPSPALPASTTSPTTFGGFYQNESPTIGDASSLSPDTPRSTRRRRGSDPESIQENVETLNRTSSRNSFIGLGIQFTNKFQVITVRGEIQGKILIPIGFTEKPANAAESVT